MKYGHDEIMKKILFASSKVHPFIKTGGLADVAGSLPRALVELSQDVRIILRPKEPSCYITIKRTGKNPESGNEKGLFLEKQCQAVFSFV